MTDWKEEDVRRIVGIKQVKKAVEKGGVLAVQLASDADARVLAPLEELCQESGVPVTKELTLKELGALSHIEVGAAAVAILPKVH